MQARIDGTRLVHSRQARQQFRQAILSHWGHACAYCGKAAGTLDHVQPRAKGGHTVQSNLVAACPACNSSKGSLEWVTWFRDQAFWDPEREADLWLWIRQSPA